ncbi:MAG: S26 family signal peptidase [Myxococcota bacterium]
MMAALAVVAITSFQVVNASATRLSPSIDPGTYVLIDRLSPELSSTPQGAVVLVRGQHDRTQQVLGRVLAKGGDQVTWRLGELRINDHNITLPAPLASLRVQRSRRGGPFPAALGLERVPYEVPRHHAYLLIDSGEGTVQGRLVPEGDVVGVARMALTHLGTHTTWERRLPRPIR